MIIVTGAAGFIGSRLVEKLNAEGHLNLVLVDEWSRSDKVVNYRSTNYIARVHRNDFIGWLQRFHESVDYVFHMGARTDTAEKDEAVFEALNLGYTKAVWEACAKYKIPLVYASSAATYGLGEKGYVDSHEIVGELQPLNPYGESKNEFDKWALQQKTTPPQWVGLKYFNVYGPNEYHKGRMASVIFHTNKQIKATGAMKLFRSHRSDFKDGEQSRDFIYVKDVEAICYFFFQHRQHSGLYNVGTGQARTFWDLATNTFKAMGLEPNISFIDTPADIRNTYQYFTEADMTKLRSIGYEQPFYSLEEGIQDYVQEYLMKR
ncbi:MAG: ADP-glyceromanno-heptose 6-epimerase [Bacteroidota bacterium]